MKTALPLAVCLSGGLGGPFPPPPPGLGGPLPGGPLPDPTKAGRWEVLELWKGKRHFTSLVMRKKRTTCLFLCMGLRQGAGPNDFYGFMNSLHGLEREHRFRSLVFYTFSLSYFLNGYIPRMQTFHVLHRLQQLTDSNYGAGTGFEVPESMGAWCTPGYRDCRESLPG